MSYYSKPIRLPRYFRPCERGSVRYILRKFFQNFYIEKSRKIREIFGPNLQVRFILGIPIVPDTFHSDF